MRVLTVLLCITSVCSYRYFQDAIPNGDNVPHPCKANYIWKGVGHLNPLGGGDRNPFGVDFKNAGARWTKALCQMDSDGDGVTNGEELGDPNCVWKPGKVPEHILGLSHPGVCTPYSDPKCKAANTWIDCKLADFKCDAINEAGVKNITVRFPETVIPPNETTYYCMMFELPTDGDYHIVASSPVIDNEDVMHHIVVMGCDETEGEITDYPMYSPQHCGMVTHPKCTMTIGVWTLGSPGTCEHKNTGYRIGQKGFKKALYQFHWNNPLLRSDYKDSSGLTFYYTPKLRMYDATTLSIGQTYLEIPPGQKEIRADGWCTAECTTRQLKAPIYVTGAFNHMHYLGRQQRIEHYRNGTKLRDITHDERYSYDSPVVHVFQEPVEIRPGDELRTTCVFKSLGRDKTTFFGVGTSDEMCLGLLTVYPAENLDTVHCLSWKGIPACKLWNFPKEFPIINGCNVHNIQNDSHPDTRALKHEVFSRCSTFKGCLEECKTYIVDTLSNHPCLYGDISDYFRQNVKYTRNFDHLNFWSALDTCKTEIEVEKVTRNMNFRMCQTGSVGNVVCSTAVVMFACILHFILQ